MRTLSYLTRSEYTEKVLSRGRGTRKLRVQLRTWPCNNRELRQRRRWRQREQQKRFSLANSSSARASRLFLYISLTSLHDYDVKIPNFMFYGGREHKTRLRVVPHFSSGIVERANREHTWRSPHARARKGSFFSLPAACRLFSRGVIFTRARVSQALLSLRKNGGLLVVYALEGIRNKITYLYRVLHA